MARGRTTTAATRLAKLEERIAELRRARAGDQEAVLVYADDPKDATERYVVERERMGAELVVGVRSLAKRPAHEPRAW